MNKNCEKLNQQLINGGFKSQIIKEDLIEFDSEIKSNPIIEKYYVRFDNKRVLVFAMALISDVLADQYSIEDLAYVLSEKTSTFAQDGIRVDIRDESLLISGLVKMGIFTSSTSLYNKVYDTMIYCSVSFGQIIDGLRWMKR